MKGFLFASGALALVIATTAMAQDRPAQPQPAQPPAKAARPGQFQPDRGFPADRGFSTARVTATRLAALEEEFELTEAQRDVRRAHVRAAEVGVKSAMLNAERLAQIAKNGIISSEELEKGKLEVEAAKAQLEIKLAELKEIEVKVKYAKKRLDDAKAAGVRSGPARPTAPVDPPPPAPRGRDRGER
jgi:hypothetical protein